ncbi:MAG TPA: hypothetical protein VNC39_14945 [Acidocella sp.]|jgi:hypothetical protein|uniref:hypothetical protein n=1 Tax=Acidocella sp. TaxID=50710 RepID=UPI002CD112D2|nr:hypothetical protein [Acidocella sp.]HVE23265.1 hypothetical protein [Acidocella sp.]
MSLGWLEAVAARAGMDPKDAELRLRRLGIAPDRPSRPAPTLTITRIAFKGEKRGSIEGTFDFSWSNLGPGVWAITSEKNFAGKSSVLEILLWCLRGSPKNLQDDVRSWLNWVSLEFSVDDQQYRVAFDLTDSVPAGNLARLRSDGTADELDRFASDDGFAAAMSGFMMRTLDLDPIPAMHGADGEKQAVEHGWAALSGGLYFGGEHKQLLGDVLMAGLPARMLQMYIGLPWANTRMQTGTARKEIDQEREHASKAAAKSAGEATAARERLGMELETATKLLKKLPTEAVSAEQLKARADEVAKLAPVGTELQVKLATAEVEATQLRSVATADERGLRDLRENIVATQFFNGLEPTCCPRCETRVTSARIKKESADFSCSLCSESIPAEQLEDTSEAIAEAEERAQASRKAADQADAFIKSLRGQVVTNRHALNEAQTALDEAVRSTAFQKRREAELEVARLEGALRERQAPSVQLEDHPDAALVRAADEEAKKAYDRGRGDILDALNAEILSLGQRMGVQALEEVKLNSNATLTITKGGAGTSFSKATAGERLRLRLATAIALLRVGQVRGLGRHPGLLIIDSPGAEEVSEMDLSTLLGELKAIAKETRGLQLFVASANPSIVDQLGEEQCRVARGNEYVW